MNSVDASRQPKFPLQESLNLSPWMVWLLACLCVWMCLGTYGVLNDNEGLYAQIANDMLTSGDIRHWIIPHLNGLPYMEKPPLLYWLTALALALFGHAEWVVRLIPSLSALACVALLMYFGQRLYRPQTGRLAAVMFISGLGVMIISRTLMFDMLLTVFLTAALMFAYLFKLESQQQDLRLAYLSLALGVLTKGFVALLIFGMVTMSWMVLVYQTLSWNHFRLWLEPVSFALFLLITMPWFLAAAWCEPIFPWFFFINEHLLRFLGLRLPHDFYAGPWWYYLPRMVLYLFPWSLLLPLAWFSGWVKKSPFEAQELMLLRKMCALAWLVPFLFFTLSSAKANYYLIVVMPFMAFNLALLLEQSHFLNDWRSAMLGLLIAAIAAALILALRMAPQLLAAKMVTEDFLLFGQSWEHFILLVLYGTIALALLAGLAAYCLPQAGLAVYSVLSVYLMLVLVSFASAMNPAISDKNLAQFIERELPGRTIYLYRNFEQHSSLPFYLKKPLPVIDSTSNDLYWGNRIRPGNAIIITSDQFNHLREPRAVLVPNNDLDEFVSQKLHTRFLHQRQFVNATLLY